MDVEVRRIDVPGGQFKMAETSAFPDGLPERLDVPSPAVVQSDVARHSSRIGTHEADGLDALLVLGPESVADGGEELHRVEEAEGVEGPEDGRGSLVDLPGREEEREALSLGTVAPRGCGDVKLGRDGRDLDHALEEGRVLGIVRVEARAAVAFEVVFLVPSGDFDEDELVDAESHLGGQMHEGEFLGPRDVPRVGVDVEDFGARGYHRAGILKTKKVGDGKERD